jgi:hypothetical protein
MYRDLKATYWWYEMNIDVTEDVDLFTTPVRAGMLQPLRVPERK